jgi:hypothetical protein
VTDPEPHAAEQAAERAARLRRAIEEAQKGQRPPSSPREFTDRAAAEVAEDNPPARDE